MMQYKVRKTWCIPILLSLIIFIILSDAANGARVRPSTRRGTGQGRSRGVRIKPKNISNQPRISVERIKIQKRPSTVKLATAVTSDRLKNQLQTRARRCRRSLPNDVS